MLVQHCQRIYRRLLLDRVLCGNVDGREEEEEGEIAGGDKNKLSFIEAIAFDLDGQLVR